MFSHNHFSFSICGSPCPFQIPEARPTSMKNMHVKVARQRWRFEPQAADCSLGFGLSDTMDGKLCIRENISVVRENSCGPESRRAILWCHCWHESLIHTSRVVVYAGCLALVRSHPTTRSSDVIGLKCTIDTLVQRLQAMRPVGWNCEHNNTLSFCLIQCPHWNVGLMVIKD